MSFRITNRLTVNSTKVVPYVPSLPIGTLIDKYWNSTNLLIQGDDANNGNVLDSSTNNFTITKTGTPAQGAVSPFANSGGSVKFNGAGDWLDTPTNTAFQLSTSDFTVEYWMYPLAGTDSNTAYRADPGNTWGSLMGYSDGTNWLWYMSTNGTSWNFIIGQVLLSVASSLNKWTHMAFTRSGSTFRAFVNGTQVFTTTGAAAVYQSGNAHRIGSANNASGITNFNGYLSNVRYVKGTALYTSNFTPSTSPLTAVTNTVLLLKFDNGKFLDGTRLNNISTIGTPSISNSTFKYGTGALSFNGTTDYLTVPDSELWNFGSGNFTVECWARPTASSPQASLVTQWDATGGGSGLSWAMMLSNDSNRYLRFLLSTNGSSVLTDVISSASLTLNDWNHCAFVRSGNVFSIYLNGTSVASYTNSVTLFNATNVLVVGSNSIGQQKFTGFMDDVRVTKGIARYTASFTPPSTKLPSDGATGGTVTYSGADVIHTFLSTGIFKSTAQISAAALVVGGGGGGGGYDRGAGGGAGGFISSSISMEVGSYSVLVGSGGSGGASGQPGFSGSNSVLSSLTAIGGGRGGAIGGLPSVGGSGGGANYSTDPTGSAGTVGQGNAGGSGLSSAGGASGGGGGAGSVGGNGLLFGVNRGGAGGNGLTSTISGTSVTYAGGGGGSVGGAGGIPGSGGSGGGGSGINGNSNGTSGTANTGGGGGGAGSVGGNIGGNGGSGIVIVRYTSTSS